MCSRWEHCLHAVPIQEIQRGGEGNDGSVHGSPRRAGHVCSGHCRSESVEISDFVDCAHCPVINPLRDNLT